jgi:uncharacterized protein YndB with AHSA1/START domain
MAANSAKHDDRVLVIEREFSAPRPLVWTMFTDPRHAANWMGPPDYPSVFHEADVRPGGKWRRSTPGGRWSSTVARWARAWRRSWQPR